MKIKTAQELVLCKSCAVYWPFCFCILLFIVVISYYSFLKIIAFVSHKAAVCLLYILIIIYFIINTLGQFTRNYTQTVKRAADNKRRYAPGEGSIPPVLLSGVSKGVPPLAHDFACKV